MRVLAINGSARKDGNTAILIKHVLDELNREGIETNFVQLGGKKIGGCVACYKCMKNKDRKCAQGKDIVNDLIAEMEASQGIILGSPTYFADLTANLKAVIERCGFVGRMNGDMFKYKVGAAVVAVRRAGAIHVFNSINHFFTISQMIIPGSSYWNIGLGRDIGEVSGDAEGVRTMSDLGKNMAWLLKKIYS